MMKTITIQTTTGETITTSMHYSDNALNCVMNALYNYGYNITYLKSYSIS